MLASWASRLQFNAQPRVERANGSIRGLRVGDVAKVGDTIYDEFCDAAVGSGRGRRRGKAWWSDISWLSLLKERG
jgi:hypothetical protein